MTDTTNLDRLRRLDPLDMSTTAELDPDGTTGRRVRAAAIAAAQRPGLAARGPRRAPLRAPRLAAGATAIAALTAVALAVGLPGGGSGGAPTAPADARAALVTAAERTAAFTSGHIVWKMAYNKSDPPLNFDLTNDVHFEGSDVDIAWSSSFHDTTPRSDRPVDRNGGSRVVGGQVFERYGNAPYERKDDPGISADAPTGVLTRVQAADALTAATRAAADVQEAKADSGTRFTATVPTAKVPDQFRPPFKRTVDSVAITAIVGDDGAVRSLALRAPGEAVDVTFDALGEPQGIAAP
jgi:hypothetical protein